MTDDIPRNQSNDLVVVGSSAGGGALSTLVSTLHKNFPAPVVLAQHLDPQRRSQLEELQARNEELQTTNDELSARTLEMQELMKQHRLEQLQISHLLERFPHYAMVVNAEELTIMGVNPTYQQIFGARDITGLPISEVFTGQEVDQLIKLLKSAAA